MNRRRFLQCAATGLFVPSAMALPPVRRNRMGVVAADNPTWTFYTTATGTWAPTITKTGAAAKWDVGGQVIVSNTPSFTLGSGTKKVKIYFDSNNTITMILIAAKELIGSVPDLSTFTKLEILYLNSNTTLTGIIPSLEYNIALNDINLSSNQLSGNIPSLTALTNLGTINLANNKLTGYSASTLPVTLNTFQANINELTATAINQILCDCDAIGTSSKTLNIGGYGNAAPTSGPPDGITAKTNLLAKSWTVTTN